eukprot:CAMPEP_0204844384 /NCGR_PEP_ID=MMETSP1347-20130617/180_1 /ASSEMBLY_ACC=CAM_ASM_000690 /TAXON_ID=215587 /ORGANISM="Aplanochytrium stocchinoi, Strain GSBS06" /LENGTH=59 /DNA_ID=CAMNT_0051983727 /DNA_START=222 /DNA_END=401 /DNA_ORIENTATION=+
MPKEKREKDRLSGTGRGKETAKSGSGGKFTWGTPGIDDMNLAKIDKGDPMYDSGKDGDK